MQATHCQLRSPRRVEDPPRRGAVYIAVLGSALIVSILAFSALALQRIQNRRVDSSADIQQAKLNAESAIELGLLIIAEDEDWRAANADANGAWFTRATGAGTCSLFVIDPADDDLDDDPNDPFVLTGVGTSGTAEQRVERYVDPRSQPDDVLHAAANAGGTISGRSDIDWDAVAAAYTAVGTEINVNSLATISSINLGKNTSFDSNADYWTGTPPSGLGLSAATQITRVANYQGHSAALRIERNDKNAGALQYVDHSLKPNTSYTIQIQVYVPYGFLGLGNYMRVSFYVRTSAGTTSLVQGNAVWVPAQAWTTVSSTIWSPNFSGDPQYAFVIVNSDTTIVGSTAGDFYIDNLDIRDNTGGRFIYRQVLGPGANPYGTANAQGIYWINCGGNDVVIERSRISGTLVLLNPGSGSQIAHGPVHIAPAAAGYPSLVVDGDFAIRATARALVESECGENGTNFNPAAVPFEFNNPLCASTDSTPNDAYPAEIQGLVGVSGDLTFENQPRVRGQVVVGGSISDSPSLEHRLDAVYSPPPSFTGPTGYEPRPASARKVVVP